ncbi:MAG TPA: ABC transporter substrate-binding protein [Acidiferrobacterales bacterium]|nr:ABC transporter substrate-binding protein [Acidiferrobacterales bacterium]
MRETARNRRWQWGASALILCVPVLLPAGAWAEPKAEPPRIGVLSFDEPNCRRKPFLEGLLDLGYIEGRTVVIECQHAGGDYSRFQTAADLLARSKPAMIVAFGNPATKAAQRATKDIPIVMLGSGEPVESGFAASFSRPGGNLTGISYYTIELNAKRLELLKSVVPRLRRVAVLVDPGLPEENTQAFLRDIRQAATVFGLEIIAVESKGAVDLERAFDEIKKANAQAVLVLSYIAFMRDAQELADITKWRGLPSIHAFAYYPALGGLMSYGPDFWLLQRRAAVYVDKILKGAKPAELPIEQPTRFEFSINLQTARELGLKVPQALLERADRVIE